MLQQPGGVNPNYLQGKQRVVYEILYDLLPDGQGMQILSGEVASLLLSASGEAEAPALVPPDGMRIGELEISPKSRRVVMGGAEVSLTPKEFDILYFLAQNRGEVFTKEQIYRAVWSKDYLLDDSNIMAFIRKLRKKIEPDPDAPKYILTIWGIGYKFNDQL